MNCKNLLKKEDFVNKNSKQNYLNKPKSVKQRYRKTKMEFCPKCGAVLIQKKKRDGCPRCGYSSKVKVKLKVSEKLEEKKKN